MAGKTPKKSAKAAKKPASRRVAAKAAKRPPRVVNEEPASRLIDRRIRDLGGWRGDTLARMRALILEADSGMTEEWKWNTPVWSHHGIVCTGEAYTKVVKLTFARGASLPDPALLFNASLEGNTRRAIDIHEGEKVDAGAFKALVNAAVARNGPRGEETGDPEAPVGQRAVRRSRSDARGLSMAGKSKPKAAAKPKLLAGGNPQIAKADGDAPVQAYIAGMPGWKRDVGRRLDALIARNVPNVRKAVKWNSPFYGIEGQGWFLNFHCFTKYVKVAFFRGASLRPAPPGESKHKEVRYLDIHEDDQLDEVQMAAWIRQAAALPGWVP